MKILPGRSFPLGATIQNDGVNFAVFSPEAEKVELLLFKNIDDTDPTVIPLDSQLNRSYNYWHIYIEGIGVNQLYGYRVYGEYNPEGGIWFDGTKVLVDPYAKAIVGEYDRKLAQHYGEDNLHSCLKSAVISDEFDWGEENYINHPISESLIYEMHLAGFTKNINSDLPEDIRGTYKGLVEKIPYLKDLGVTAVELLPVYAFDKQDAPNGKENYWGYSPINFFAVHADYAAGQTPQEIVNEFKALVKVLHKNNIEVLLDVVYNHTTENDGFRDGPTLCLRGFANSSYYLLEADGSFKNFSGTGNTLNGNHSVVRRMIIDSLIYWRQEMRIDGFRFDLASVLSRDEDGIPLQNPPILWSIDSHPALANAKIIAEPWDAVGLHQVTSFAGDRWGIWNDDYRDTIRKFVKGDEGQIKRFSKSFLGSQYEINARHVDFAPHQNIHFITCHDGFTMNDLVSYNKKHNLANGENNRDGNSLNHSWNCGVEGETDDSQINKQREKQIKNFFTILLLSHGTPMLSMGDELRRTQSGNNNVYCQDNPLAWMNWEQNPETEETLKLVKELINFRKKHQLFSYPNYFKKAKRRNKPYVLFHGIVLNQPDWNNNSHSLAIEMIHPTAKEHLFLIFNMYHEPLNFQLPKGDWYTAFNTNEAKYEKVQDKIECPSRTVIVLEQFG